LWELASEVVERGGAIVFATQHLEEVHSVANRVLTLLDGRLVFDGTVADYEHAPEADVFA
jgi:ABC-type multidrug transport system ATPase subunit